MRPTRRPIMSNVEKAASANTFFPNSKNVTGKKASKLDKTVLTRNDPARSKELSNIAQTDAKVTIPDSIKDFSRIKKAVDAAPPIDNSEKIARLKKEISSGTYKIDYDGLADKILESEF